MRKYIQWMVSYEFPALSDLALRMDGIANRVHGEELSLYIRRKDVVNVVKELDLKTVESSVSVLRKRLEKHFNSDYENSLKLISSTWTLIKNRLTNILARLETAASVSYQISLEVDPT